MRKPYTIHAFYAVSTLLFLVLLVTACTKEPEDTEGNWCDETFAAMTEAQKVGQMFCLSVDPIRYFMYPDYQATTNLLIAKYKPGAIHLVAHLDTVNLEIRNEFNGSKLNDLVTSLHNHSDIPLLIAANFESGAWYWDKKATHFPFPLALGATLSTQHAYQQGKITAVEAKAQGINWLFSPVMNIAVNPEDTEMLIQSIGNDPETVGLLGSHFIRGCQEVGVAACMKYLPSELQNSQWTLPPDQVEPAQADVFKKGIDADVMAVMGSLIDLTDINPEEPELETRKAFFQSLRETYGFEGLFISELEMSGTEKNSRYAVNSFLKILETEGTMFIVPENFTGGIPFLDLLLNSVQVGTIPIEPFNEVSRKTLSMKKRLNLQNIPEEVSLRAMAGIGLPEYHHTSQEISNESVTLLKNENNIIPIDYRGKSIVSISFLDELSHYNASLYEQKMSDITDTIISINIFGEPDQRLQYEVERRAAETDVVICSFFQKPEVTDHIGTISPVIEQLIKHMIKINKHVVLVSYYDPYLILHFPDVQGYLNSYSPFNHSMDAALDVIFGKTKISGRLPVHISDDFPLGFGLKLSPTAEEK